MTSPHRKRRGAESQSTVAAYFRDHGWPHCTDAGAGRQGSDLLGVLGLAVEIKARRSFSPLAWIRQASKEHGLPLVVHRPDGMGPASIADWPVTLRLEDMVAVLRAAGYGDPVEGES